MTTNCHYQQLFTQLGAQDRLIAANLQLAKVLQQQYATWQIAHGNLVWSAGHIMALSHWIEQLWQTYQLTACEVPSVLSQYQQSWWWQQIVAESDTAKDLLNITHTAQLAQDAWRTCVAYNQPLDAILQTNNRNVRAFLQWANAFEMRCKQQHAVAPAQRLTLLCEGLTPQVDYTLYLIGFDAVTITPQLQTFLNVLTQQGVTVQHVALPVRTVDKHVVGLLQRELEIRAAIRHAMQYCSAKPTLKYAIIVPDLAAQQDDIARECAELKLADVDYAISASKPLMQHAMIDDAFHTLKLTQLTDRDQWIAWLTSPFIAGARKRRMTRDKLAKAIYTCLPKQIEWCDIVAQAAQLDTLAALPILSAVTDETKMTRQHWCQHWLQQLHDVGWPGERACDDAASRIVNQFYAVLQQWVMAFPGDGIMEVQALDEVQHCLDNTVLSITDHVENAQIQIRDMIEVTDMVFDHIWIVGMNDTVLPVQAKPNPFLPIDWQQRLHVPYHSPQYALQIAKHGLSRLVTHNTHVTASYAKMDADVQLSKSALLADWPEQLSDIDVQSVAAKAIGTAQLTLYDDSQGLPLSKAASNDTAQQQEAIGGGAQLFKSQALCPFQAYARHRLSVTQWQPVAEYLDARQIGTILHQILANCWQRLHDQKTLLQQTKIQLQTLISQQVKAVLQHWQQRYPHLLSTAVQQLELVRLTQLVSDWLDGEKQRPPFTVSATETAYSGEIEAIPLKLRIDRLDQLATGQTMVIDYKTSKETTVISTWLGERPIEPQLPLYVLLTDADAASFANVRAVKSGFSGLSQDTLSIDGIRTVAEDRYSDQDSWQEQKAQWQASFAQLATEIKQGHAAVDPISITQACQYCDLRRLCRLQ